MSAEQCAAAGTGERKSSVRQRPHQDTCCWMSPQQWSRGLAYVHGLLLWRAHLAFFAGQDRCLAWEAVLCNAGRLSSECGLRFPMISVMEACPQRSAAMDNH